MKLLFFFTLLFASNALFAQAQFLPSDNDTTQVVIMAVNDWSAPSAVLVNGIKVANDLFVLQIVSEKVKNSEGQEFEVPTKEMKYFQLPKENVLFYKEKPKQEANK